VNSRRIHINFSPDASNGSRTLTLVPCPNQHSSENENHHTDVLSSWKEIAAYLNRGVRTVQRWESELHLPVHRPLGKSRSAVLALRAELDDWLRRTPSRFNAEETAKNLLDIACELRALIERLVMLANVETQPERKRLLEALNSIIDELEEPNGKVLEKLNGNFRKGNSPSAAEDS
jgi:predicted DNA-binding transcriptional regulator AlpA